KIGRTDLGTTARAAHTVITAEAGSTGVVLLENKGSAALSENLEIAVKEGAQLTVISLQEWDDAALHMASHFATIARAAKLKCVSVTRGGDVVRVNPPATRAGERAEAELDGLYFADAGQYIEHQVVVNHAAANTVSHVTYKGALQGKGAHTVW